MQGLHRVDLDQLAGVGRQGRAGHERIEARRGPRIAGGHGLDFISVPQEALAPRPRIVDRRATIWA